MATPVANPSDVRLEYETYLSDPEINDQIEKAARQIRRHNDVSGWDDDKVRDLEAAYTAYRIATRVDRAASSTGSGRSTTDYESRVVDELRDEIDELDESGELIDDPTPEGSYEVY